MLFKKSEARCGVDVQARTQGGEGGGVGRGGENQRTSLTPFAWYI